MVNDALHRAIFSQFRLVNDAASMRQFSTTAGGSFYGVGRGGAITGRGADLLLIDDPLKDHEEAHSEVTRRVALARAMPTILGKPNLSETPPFRGTFSTGERLRTAVADLEFPVVSSAALGPFPGPLQSATGARSALPDVRPKHRPGFPGK
jgi:hypothetical protein